MVNNNKNFHQDIMQFFDDLCFYKKDDPTISALLPAVVDELQPCSIQEIKNIYSKFQQNISQETESIKNRVIELREKVLFLKEKVDKEQLVVDHPEKSHLSHCDQETIQGYITHYTAKLPERKRELQQLQNELQDLETTLSRREFDDLEISLLCEARIQDINIISDIESRCQKEIGRLQNEITSMNTVITNPQQSDLKDLPPQDLQRFIISYPASIQKRKTQVAQLEKEINESKESFFDRVKKFENHDIYHNASTRKKIDTLNHKIIEIENAISAGLTENDTLLNIKKTSPSNPPQLIQIEETIAENKKKIAEWTTNYESFVNKKLSLVKSFANKANPVVEMSIPSITKKGTLLYHCTKNSAVMDSILATGPRKQTLLDAEKDEVGNFKTPCLGNGGIYVSVDSPSYLSDEYNCIMVFEVVDDIAETATIPCDQLQLQFVERGCITETEYQEGFVQLQQEAKMLRNLGASGNTSERVIRNPDKKIRVVGVIENFRGETKHFKNSAVIPIHKYLETRPHIQLHDSWATVVRYHKDKSLPHSQNEIPFNSLKNVIGVIPDQHQPDNIQIDNYFQSIKDIPLNEPKALITQQFNTRGYFDSDGFFKDWKSGIILREPDGRIWIEKVANDFAGYKYSFPKGTLEANFSLQQNALKELYEETGMTGTIQSFLCDNQKLDCIERYYVAHRTAGTPTEAGWETDHMVLASPKEALALLNVEADKHVCRRFMERN